MSQEEKKGEKEEEKKGRWSGARGRRKEGAIQGVAWRGAIQGVAWRGAIQEGENSGGKRRRQSLLK